MLLVKTLLLGRMLEIRILHSLSTSTDLLLCSPAAINLYESCGFILLEETLMNKWGTEINIQHARSNEEDKTIIRLTPV